MSIAVPLSFDLPAAPPLTCAHCGDVCGDHPALNAGHVFCCGGCEAVFTLLHREGLEAFYTCDVSPGVSQRMSAGSDGVSLAALDDPTTAARFVEFTNELQARAVFTLPSIHCASCLWLIERLWRVDPGILRADVDLVRRAVRVTYRTDQISLRHVAECLTAIGYPPSLNADAIRPPVPRERRALYVKIGVAGFAFGNAMIFSLPRYFNGSPLAEPYQSLFGGLNLMLAVVVLTVSGGDYFAAAARAVRHRVLTLDVPIAIGLAALFGRTVIDITLARGEGFADSFSGLVFFLLIGQLFQRQAFDRISFDRTFKSFLPLAVRVRDHDTGRDVSVPLEHLRPGDRVTIRAGEVVPSDARVAQSVGHVDLSFITGEDRPIAVESGQIVPAGAKVTGHALDFVLTSDVAHGRLASLWGRTRAIEPVSDAFTAIARRFGLWFTVAALGLAAAGFAAWWPDVSASVGVATAVLIIACPCALTLAAPLALGTAMTALGERGVYLKTPGVALQLARLETIAFDKTGTLTSKVNADGASKVIGHAAWRLVERLAAQSIHPISRGIVAAGEPPVAHADDARTDLPIHEAPVRASTAAAPPRVEGCEETIGQGIVGCIDGHDVVIGARDFVAARATGVPQDEGRGPAVGIDGRFAGWVPVSFVPRPGLDRAVADLASSYHTILISGDAPGDLSTFREAFGGRMWFRQSPEDKVSLVRALQTGGRLVLMVGDGLNDAAALAAADVGMAVSDETACVVPACDVVISGRRLRDLPAILRFTRRTRQVVAVCFLVSVLYNIVGLSLALTGALTPLAAAVLMPVSSLSVIGLSVGVTRRLAHGLPR